MKKVLVVLMVALMLVSLCACTYVPSTRFMSRMQVNSLVKEYGTPQAELTLNYKVGGKEVEVKVVYNLLLSQAPLATIRFIQLVEDNFYDDAIIDTYNSTYRYMVMGRYAYREIVLNEGTEKEKTEMRYFKNESDVTFKGEFKSNAYKEPKDGYSQFSIFSLAMYHSDATTDDNNFDTANGTLILALANETLNSDNYAVFAEMANMSYKVGDGEFNKQSSKVSPDILTNLKSFTSRTSRPVYDDMTMETSTSISLMSTTVKLHVRMLGDFDWSKLPTIG